MGKEVLGQEVGEETGSGSLTVAAVRWTRAVHQTTFSNLTHCCKFPRRGWKERPRSWRCRGASPPRPAARRPARGSPRGRGPKAKRPHPHRPLRAAALPPGRELRRPGFTSSGGLTQGCCWCVGKLLIWIRDRSLWKIAGLCFVFTSGSEVPLPKMPPPWRAGHSSKKTHRRGW